MWLGLGLGLGLGSWTGIVCVCVVRGGGGGLEDRRGVQCYGLGVVAWAWRVSSQPLLFNLRGYRANLSYLI